jgi:hypothetical protein
LGTKAHCNKSPLIIQGISLANTHTTEIRELFSLRTVGIDDRQRIEPAKNCSGSDFNNESGPVARVRALMHRAAMTSIRLNKN